MNKKASAEYRYILESYKGMNTRYNCPGCGKLKTFSRYLDTETDEYIHESVGRCNREVNCGYNYTPKKYFLDNHILLDKRAKQYAKPMQARNPPPKQVSFIPFEPFEKSLQKPSENNFVKFLCALFGTEITNGLIEKYFIGTSKQWNGATVFWQIDITGKVRTGQIMVYNPKTGKRTNRFTFVHTLLKIDNFNLNQCFFGEHILQNNSKPVAIFESPKTALISNIYFPEYICLACGGLNGLSITKCKVLLGRTVILFPDLSKPYAKVNCFEKWYFKSLELSQMFPGTRFIVSDLLERKATESDKKQGLDLADFLLRFDVKEFQRV